MAQDRKKTVARGYGATHKQLRAEAKKLVDSGMATCWRCGKWLPPGRPFDLGHDDDDRSIYRGPECVPCNRATSGRKPGVSRRRPPGAPSRSGRTCEICGSTYKAAHDRQRTCSRACGLELKRRNAPLKPGSRAPRSIECVECGAQFTTTHGTKQTCSPECSKQHGNRLSREYYHTNPECHAATLERSRARRWKL